VGAPFAATGVTALTVLLLADVLRAWMPSVIFVYARAGSTPATQMGAFAFLPFLAVLVVAAVLRWRRPADLVAAAAAGLVLARVLLQGTDGGDAQLWAGTAAVTAGLLLLTALSRVVAATAAGVGVVSGLALDAALHTTLRSTDLVWRDGVASWIAVLLIGALTLAAAVRLRRSSETVPAPGRAWLAVGPVLVIHLVVSGLVSRPAAVLGWPEALAAALVLAAHAAAVVLVVVAGRVGARLIGPVGAAVVAIGLAGAVLVSAAPAVAIGHALLPLGLGLCLVGSFSGTAPTRARRSAVTAASGLVLFVLLGFGYFAAYDMALPLDNRLFLAVAAAVIGVVAVTGRDAVPPRAAGAPPTVAIAAVALLIAAAGTGAVAAAAAAPEASPGDGFPVRIMLYNVQMGFDTAGRYSGPSQGQVVAAESPDLVVLNEVSRGWLVNGNVDVLPELVERTALPAQFFPAADPVWGNAVLSRHPVREVRGAELPRAGAAMRRSVLSMVVDLGGGQELGLVATHLHHVEGEPEVRRRQVEVLDREARRLAVGGRPVVVAGDMNAEPGSPELAPLEEWLVEATADQGPQATWPSWDPRAHIDLIYVTPDLRASEVAVPASEASDHLGVAVTLTR
jgi:endonuclease/exonuclease/phosphatase family metal-dependent hydrolase